MEAKHETGNHMKGCLLLLVALSLVSCTDIAGPSTAVQSPQALASNWEVLVFQDTFGRPSDPGVDQLVVTFDIDGTLVGNGGNMFFGTYAAQTDGAITIHCVGTTLRGISPGSRHEDFVAALNDATSYEIKNDAMNVRYAKGQTLRFRRVADL